MTDRQAPLSEGFTVELDNELIEIKRLNQLIEALAQRTALGEDVVFQVMLVFDELITNVIAHGFPDGGQHKIEVSLRLEGDRLIAEIGDAGIAFNPLEKAPPDVTATLEERSVGGLGIHFVRTAMDTLDYRWQDGRNRLIMTKLIARDTP